MHKFIHALGLFVGISLLVMWGVLVNAQALEAPVLRVNDSGLNFESRLFWSYSNSPSIEFHIERSLDGTSAWIQISTTPVAFGNGAFQYYDYNVTCDTSYFYRIRAYNVITASYSDYSNVVGTMPYDCAQTLAEEICEFSPFLQFEYGSGLESATLSGDGSRVVVRYNSELRIYDSSAVLLDSIPNVTYYSISENAQRIAFVSYNNHTGENPLSVPQLFLWENGNLSQISNNLYYSDRIYSPSISSDGTRIAFLIENWNNEGVSDTTNYLWQEASGLNKFVPESNTVRILEFAGNGQDIVYVDSKNYAGENPYYQNMLYRWNVATGVSFLGDLDNSIDNNIDYMDSHLYVDSDASNVALRIYEPLLSISLYVWNSDTGLNSINFGDNYYDSGLGGFSADGSRLIFMKDFNPTGENPDGNEEVFFLDNGVIKQISSTLASNDVTINLHSVSISSDGSKILAHIAYPFPNSPSNAESSEFGLYVGDCNAPEVPSSQPTPVSDLAVSLTAPQILTLTWSDTNSDETGYYIERSENGELNWEFLAEVAPDTSSYEDDFVFCGRLYNYRLRTIRNGELSVYSNIVIGTSNACSEPISPMFLEAMAAFGNSISVSWADIPDEDTIHIERAVAFTDDYTEIAVLPSNTTNFLDEGLACDILYTYRVRFFRVSDAKYSIYAYSNEVGIDCEVATISNLEVTATTASSISLSWSDNATDETAYTIYYGQGIFDINVGLPADSTNYEITGLACNRPYAFYVAASIPSGDAKSEPILGTTAACPPPPLAPSSLSASAGTGTNVNLTWLDNSDDETAFYVEYSRNNGQTWNRYSAIATNSTSYTVALACSSNYQFRIYAYVAGLDIKSDYSNIVNYTSANCASLPAPSNLQANSITQSSLNLTWIDNSTNEFNFRIERSLDGGLTWSQIDITSANINNRLVTGLSCETNYQFRVRAYRSSDQYYSAYSNVVDVTTPTCLDTLTAPSNLVVNNISANSVGLTWTDNATDETSYYVERSQNGGSGFSTVATLATNSTSYTDNSVTCTYGYVYRVRAYRAADTHYSAESNRVFNIPMGCPAVPSAPSDLSLSSQSLNSLVLLWVDNSSDETSFQLERSVNGIAWAQIKSLSANTTSVSINNLNCGDNLNYHFRVRAVRNYAPSSYSDILIVPFPCSLATPSALSIVSSSQDSISLVWTDNASDETGYRIERSTNAGLTWQEISLLSSDATNFVDVGLGCGTAYQYRVRAYRNTDSAFSDYTNILSVVTSDCESSPQTICTMSQFNTSHHTGYSIGAVYISADGSRLAMNYQASPVPTTEGLYLYDVATETLLETFPQVFWTDMSANGQQLVFQSSSDFTGQNADGNTEIFYWNNGVFTQITNTTGNANLSEPHMSDDGSKVVFSGIGAVVGDATSGEFIYTWDATNGIQKLIPDARNSISSTPDVIISGDGSTVAFFHDGDLGGMAAPHSHLYLWDAVNGVQLLYPFGYDFEILAYTMDINFDGSRIVFTHSGDPLGLNPDMNAEIFLWDASSGLQQLTESIAPNSSLSLSLDASGQRIMLVSDIDLDPDDGQSETLGYYLYDEGYGFSQYTFDTALGVGGFGKTLSADGLTAAMIYPVGWDGTGDATPYTKLFTASCTAADYLAAPDSLSSNVNVDNHVELSWVDNSLGETSIVVERSISGNNDWLEIATVSANTSNYTDNNLGCANNYDYRVRAYREVDAHYSDYSNVETVNVSACGLDAPTALSISNIAQSSISLAWNDNASDESEYRVERSDDGIFWTEIAQANTDSESFTDNTALCETLYDYRVRAYRESDGAYSIYSNIASGTTLLCDLAVPTGLSITGNSQTSLSLAWLDTNNDETNYRLERSLAGQNTWAEIVQVNGTSHSDTGLSCGTSYDYRLRAYRSVDASFSLYTSTVTGSTALCNLVSPTSLIVTGTGETSINLSWADNSSDESEYRLERSPAGQDNWSEIAQIAANSSSYSNTSLACETSYDYRLRGYRSADSSYSTYSNIVSGTTTTCTTLNAPTDIQMTGSTAFGLSISWTDNAIGENSYEIERSTDGTNWQALTSLAANSTSFSDTGLFCQTGYQYRVRAYQSGTDLYSPYGTSTVFITATCPPLLASVLSVTGSTSNSISLMWTLDTATSFSLSYSTGGNWTGLGTFERNTNNYVHSPLICGQTMLYRVESFRQQDSASAVSSTLTTQVPACPAPVSPSAPIVLNSNSSMVTLQIPALPSGVSSMTLQRSNDGVNWLNLGVANAGNFFDSNVSCGTTYQYRLIALRAADGQASAPSTSAVALTSACPVAVSNVVGLFRNGVWSFVESINPSAPAEQFSFGDASWQPLVGDWNGDGVDGIGLYKNGQFILRSIVAGQIVETNINFGDGQTGWQAIAGDWNGDGVDSIGLYRNGLFLLSDDNLSESYVFNLGNGQAGWIAIAGDWDGNSSDAVGLYKDGLWLLLNTVLDTSNVQTIQFGPAQVGWLPVVGDWNADGIDTIGLFNNGLWRMRLTSNAGGEEISLVFGSAGDVPLAIYEGSHLDFILFGN